MIRSAALLFRVRCVVSCYCCCSAWRTPCGVSIRPVGAGFEERKGTRHCYSAVDEPGFDRFHILRIVFVVWKQCLLPATAVDTFLSSGGCKGRRSCNCCMVFILHTAVKEIGLANTAVCRTHLRKAKSRALSPCLLGQDIPSAGRRRLGQEGTSIADSLLQAPAGLEESQRSDTSFAEGTVEICVAFAFNTVAAGPHGSRCTRVGHVADGWFVPHEH